MEDRHGRCGWAPATYLGPVVDRAKKDTNPRQSDIVGKKRNNCSPRKALDVLCVHACSCKSYFSNSEISYVQVRPMRYVSPTLPSRKTSCQ